ncbi:MAG: protein kinase [Pirellulaceae bacterium]|nr:protein kinase [Pirellulaceae bacterium]
MENVEQLVEKFLTELRAGEEPDVDRFCNRFPQFANELREILPTVLLFELSLQSTWPKHDHEQRIVPEQIGQYEIVREIGAGGMGIVYEARHIELGRRVALKVLTASLSTDRTHRERFHREIRLASNLHHTNIVPVFETGTYAGTPFFTMQLIDGQSLEHWPIQTRQLSESVRFRLAATIICQAADALQYANNQGILHRDIKPSNLLRDSQDIVWITDFGLARQAADGVTRTGDIVGTLRYIAPERFSTAADHRSDLYSLGLTLYELCTLRPAFPELDQVRLQHDILESRPPRPRSLVPSIPRDLETIILRAIEKDPKLRYQSADEFADELRLWLDDRPIRSCPVTAWEQLWRWGRRNPLSASLASTVALMLLILIGVLAYSAHRRGLVIDELNRTHQTSQLRLYESYLGRAQANRWSGRPGQNYMAMEAIGQAANLVDTLFSDPVEREVQRFKLRNEAIAAMVLTDISPMKQWENSEDERVMMAFDEGFTMYALAESTRDIAVRRVVDDADLDSIPSEGALCWEMQLASDGRYFVGVFHRQGQSPETVLRVWDTQEHRETLRVDGLLRPTIWDWEESSQSLAVFDRQHRLLLFDFITGDQRQVVEADVRPLATCFMDSNRLAVARNEKLEIEILDLASLAVVQTLDTDDEITGLAWSSTSQILAAGSAVQGEIYLWKSPENSTPNARRLSGHRGRVTRLYFATHGQVLASNSWDSTVRIWDTIGARELMQIEAVAVANPGFGRDDRVLAMSGLVNQFWLANVTYNGPLRNLPRSHSEGHEWALSFHAIDDHLLAVATVNGLVFWDCRRGETVGKVDSGLVRTVDFSSDGQIVYVGGEQGITQCRIQWQNQSNASSLDILETTILDPTPVYRANLSGDNDRIVAFSERTRMASVFDIETRSTIARTGEHRNLDRALISPDGRWIVTSTWGGSGLRVWDAISGELVREMNSQYGNATIAFSPSGTFLAATDGGRQYLWRVADWELVHEWQREEPDGWPGPVTFSPDEHWLVLPQNRTTARLVEIESGKCLAILESPRRMSLSSYAVSPSGRYIALLHGEGIQLWDLKHLRQRLATLGLDW